MKEGSHHGEIKNTSHEVKEVQDRSERRWLALWQRMGARSDARPVLADLLTRYAEPHRSYHTLTHIDHCLTELEQARQLAQNPDAVEMALWYHDTVYNTRAGDNEQKSAELALEVTKNAALSDDFGRQVVNLILSTKHAEAPSDPDVQLLVDIDLSVLGQPEDKFDEYERQVRKEYEWVPDEMFAEKRSDILSGFLKRPAIYSTQLFRDKYEAQARRNIARSLARLSGRR